MSVGHLSGTIQQPERCPAVTPAQAGVQCLHGAGKSLDPGLRRGDGMDHRFCAQVTSATPERYA